MLNLLLNDYREIKLPDFFSHETKNQFGLSLSNILMVSTEKIKYYSSCWDFVAGVFAPFTHHRLPKWGSAPLTEHTSAQKERVESSALVQGGPPPVGQPIGSPVSTVRGPGKGGRGGQGGGEGGAPSPAAYHGDRLSESDILLLSSHSPALLAKPVTYTKPCLTEWDEGKLTANKIPNQEKHCYEQSEWKEFSRSRNHWV